MSAVLMNYQSFGEYKENDTAKTLLQRDDCTTSDLICAVDCRNGTENTDLNGTLQEKSNGGVSYNLQNVVRERHIVRRLTPLECERLQGYPDGWTDIGEWTDTKGNKHKAADSPRYKALGNSIAIPPWLWVLSRLNEYCEEKTMASLFDGIGGFPLIWEFLNGTGSAVWCSEIEEFPIAVTKRRFSEKMTQFEIIMRTDTPELPAEIGNFEEVKSSISEALEQYSTDVAVTEETVKDAEKTRAHLRRVKDQVEQYRKDAKAAYLEKFNKLETQCKELSGMIEQPITAIDTKIKEFENAESEKKYSELETFFGSIGAPEWLNLTDVMNPKWKNKTATLSKLRQEISEAVCKIEDDFADIEKMYAQSPLWTAISDKFKETKDKSKTLVYAAQIERQHSEEQKRAAEIQRQREAEEAARAQAAQNAICEPEAPQAVTQPETAQNASQEAADAPTPMIRGTFRVEGTREQIKALSDFLKSNGIRYEVVK